MNAPQRQTTQRHTTMTSDDHIVRGNGNYQKQLAECLERTLGVAAAISACQAHGWEGVLQHLIPRGSSRA